MKSFKHWALVVGGCLFAVGLLANAGRAAYVDDDNKLPSPVYRSIPENSIDYSTPAGNYRIGSFFDVFPEIQRVDPPVSQGESRIGSFFDIFTEIELTDPSGATAIRESPSKQSMGFTRLNGLPPGVPYIGDFATELLQLDFNLPGGVMIRESPSKASLGRTLITSPNPGGGPFFVDSFFDVFTELSLDGGANWYPSSGGLNNDGALRIEGAPLSAAVPELSSCLVWLVGSLMFSYFGCRRANC